MTDAPDASRTNIPAVARGPAPARGLRRRHEVRAMPGSMLESSELSEVERRPLLRVEYERLAELGFFENEKVELLDGVIVKMSPIGPAHRDYHALLTELLVKALPPHLIMVPPASYPLSDISEPEPELMVVEHTGLSVTRGRHSCCCSRSPTRPRRKTSASRRSSTRSVASPITGSSTSRPCRSRCIVIRRQVATRTCSGSIAPRTCRRCSCPRSSSASTAYISEISQAGAPSKRI